MTFLFAHHGPDTVAIVAALFTFGGPTLFALRCWLWERRNAATQGTDHDHDGEHQH